MRYGLSAFALSLCLLAAGPTLGQPAAMENGRGPAINQIVDRFDAEIAVLKANLRLSEEQGRNWGGFQQAFHDVAVTKATSARDASTRERSALADGSAGTSAQSAAPRAQDGAAPTNSLAQAGRVNAMRMQADEYADLAANLRKVADAVDPLYATLDNRQRGEVLKFVDKGFGEMYQGIDDSARRRR